MRYHYKNDAGHERTIEAPMTNAPPSRLVFLPDGTYREAAAADTDFYFRDWGTVYGGVVWRPASLRPGTYWPGGKVPGSSASFDTEGSRFKRRRNEQAAKEKADALRPRLTRPPA